jgi:3-deoxy-D-manno-octulosonic-acid transferase
MLTLYRFGIWFYWLILRLISPFHSKARKFKTGRHDWKQKLTLLFNDHPGDVIWFHAASLGEFEQGRPVMEALKRQYPSTRIFLTFFSPSGYEIRKNYEHADWVFYLPIDTPKNARFLVDTIQPKMAIFIKYEFWYFYLKELQRQAIPTLMISCIFRPNQLYFNKKGSFFLPILRGIDHYFVQDEASFELAKNIEIPFATIAGDTRFDRVVEIANGAKRIPIMEKFKGNSKLMVLGSTWPSDIVHLTEFIQTNKHQLKFAIAPHNISESDISKLLLTFPDAVKFSDGPSNIQDSSSILIIDNMGMLSSLYSYGDFAFIGGAFRGALHNTLEAAVYAIPVAFGEHPNNKKFKEAIELVNNGGGFTFSDKNEFNLKFKELFENQSKYTKMSQAAGAYVKANAGATAFIM